MKGDNNKIIICLVNKGSKDPLDNLIGIGSNFRPLITILTPIIEASWATASGETVSPQKKKKHAKKKVPPQKMPRIEKTETQKIPFAYEAPVESVETQTTESTQDNFVSNIYPKPGDEVGMQINTAFDLLIQRLKTATGEEFSNELQKIADLILEKRGFSVTLHKIRSLINKYKEQLAPIISQKEKDEIFEEIEEFKKRLL